MMSGISCKKFNVISMIIHKWNGQESFERIKGEAQSRALSSLRVNSYSFSEVRFMSTKTEI
jgi:hypothetical protein